MAPTTPAKPAAAAPSPKPAETPATDKSGAVETKKPDAAVQSTANTTDANKGAGGTIATEGNFSSKAVDGVSIPKKDEGTAGVTSQGAGVATGTAPSPDPNANIGLTAEQQAALDAQKAKDDNPEPTEAELDALDRAENGGKTLAEIKAEQEENEYDDRRIRTPGVRLSLIKLVRLASMFNPTTPDSHSLYGYGGVSLSLGDLRNVAAIIERNTGVTKDSKAD